MSIEIIDETIPSESDTTIINKKDIEFQPEFEEKDIESQEMDEQEMDEQEMIASAMSGDKIKELLSATGPTVKAVLLKTDGTAQEILYDSTPSKNHVTQILDAPPSILGQYADLDVIVVGARCEQSPPEFALNTHKLRYPFNNNSFYGDIFLYRFSQDCVMQDFTLDEYNEFAAKSQDDIGKVFKPSINDNDQVFDDDVDDEDVHDEEEDEQFGFSQDFMREIILNKVKSDFPAKFGREPTDEELESYVSGTIQAAGKLFGFGDLNDNDNNDNNDNNEIEFDDDDEDEDYDPNEDEQQVVVDAIEDIPDENDLENDKKDIESTINEYKVPLMDINEEEEEAIVNSQEFETELRDAIENVQQIAKIDKEKILLMARQEYMKDTGEEPTQQMVADAFKMFAIDHDHDEKEDEKEDENNDNDNDNDNEIDAEVFEKEFTDALDNVKELGKMHQKEFVDKICQTYAELHCQEPTQEELCAIFGRIQDKLADEAREEFIEENEVADDVENDPDYKPNDDELQQVEEDKKIDVLEELVQTKEENNEDNEEENTKIEEKKVTILVTPVKKKASGSRMGIYLDQQDEKKTLEFASAKFEKINGRKPTEDDTKRLKEFLTTGMLFESEINTNIFNGDDEEDEDYLPEKDTFDYSKDIEDEIEFANEDINDINGSDENEDTSNMINID